MSTSSSLRTVQRSVGAAAGGEAQDPFSLSNNTNNNTKKKKKKTNSNNRKTRPTNYNNSSSTSKTTISLSSSSSSSPLSYSFNFPLSAAPTRPTDDDEFGWVSINGTEDEGLYDDFVFGSVPSKDEAQHAVSALQQ